MTTLQRGHHLTVISQEVSQGHFLCFLLLSCVRIMSISICIGIGNAWIAGWASYLRIIIVDQAPAFQYEANFSDWLVCSEKKKKRSEKSVTSRSKFPGFLGLVASFTKASFNCAKASEKADSCSRKTELSFFYAASLKAIIMSSTSTVLVDDRFTRLALIWLFPRSMSLPTSNTKN